jgi:predicted PurR-regulated permease PerM
VGPPIANPPQPFTPVHERMTTLPLLPRQFAGRTGGGQRLLLFAVLVLLMKVAAALLVPIALALVLTFVFAPLVRRLRLHGVPEPVGAGLVVLALLLGAVLAFSTLVGPASRWWDRAPATLADLSERIDHLRRTIPMLAPPPAPPVEPGHHPALNPGKTETAPPADPLKERIASEGVALTRVVLGRIASFGLSTAATVILLFFLLASEHWMIASSVAAIPRRRTRALVLAGVRAAEREIARFVGVLALVNLGVAIVTAGAMWWLALPNPVLWGTVAGALNFIPYLGPVMTAGLLALAGIVTFDTAGAMLAPAFAFISIHAIESNLVSPWFVGRRLVLSQLSVFLSVMFFGWLWGIAGALIAVPVLVGLRSLARRNRGMRLWCAYLEGGHRTPPNLKLLLRPARHARREGAP